MTPYEVATPHGPARVHRYAVNDPRAVLVLGHGAAGGVQTPDLAAAREAAGAERLTVVLVEQPYRVAGRRSPPPAQRLDAAWCGIVERLRADQPDGLPFVVGGRSLGARVACRTAAAVGAVAVLCLAFPLEPPRRSSEPRPSRLPELDAVSLPMLLVQGERDPFGIPPPGASRSVVVVPGDHGLKADPAAVAAAVREWLRDVVRGASRRGRRTVRAG